MRAELDAALFHLCGEYRTKRLILQMYDKMTEAMATRHRYETMLDPPAGEGPRHPATEW